MNLITKERLPNAPFNDYYVTGVRVNKLKGRYRYVHLSTNDKNKRFYIMPERILNSVIAETFIIHVMSAHVIRTKQITTAADTKNIANIVNRIRHYIAKKLKRIH